MVGSTADVILSDTSFRPAADARLLSPPRNWPGEHAHDDAHAQRTHKQPASAERCVARTAHTQAAGICRALSRAGFCASTGCFKDDEALRKFLGKRGLQSRRCRLVEATLPADLAAQAAAVELHPSDSFVNARRIKEQLGWAIVKGFAVFEIDDAPHKFVAHTRWWSCTPFDAWIDLTPAKPTSFDAGVVFAESDLAVSHAPSVETLAAEKRAADIRKAAIEASERARTEAMGGAAAVSKQHEADRRRVMGQWKHHNVRHGRLRMGLSPSGRYALEAECWSPAFVDLETQDDFFLDLDETDEHYPDACQLRVKGTWELQTVSARALARRSLCARKHIRSCAQRCRRAIAAGPNHILGRLDRGGRARDAVPAPQARICAQGHARRARPGLVRHDRQ
eukprot:1095496-Prymnesium_polylepis.1